MYTLSTLFKNCRKAVNKKFTFGISEFYINSRINAIIAGPPCFKIIDFELVRLPYIAANIMNINRTATNSLGLLDKKAP